MLLGTVGGVDVGRVQAEVVGVGSLLSGSEVCIFAAVEEGGEAGEESED